MDTLTNYAVSPQNYTIHMGPFVPYYLLYPTLTLYENVLEVEKYFNYGYIPRLLYDEWMAVNGGSYQINGCRTLDPLWLERFDKIAIIEQDQVKIKNNYNTYMQMQPVKYNILKLVKCHIHGKLHARLNDNLPKKLNRDMFKQFNQLFPYSCNIDAKCTQLDCGTQIYQMILNHQLPDVKMALLCVPVGSSNTIITAMLAQLSGNYVARSVHDIMMADKACCLSTDSYVEYFKAITVAARRTGKLPNGYELSTRDIGLLAYWEMSSGRGIFISDWEEEKDKRINKCIHMRPFGSEEAPSEATNEAFLAQLKPVMQQIISEVFSQPINWPTWKEHLYTRQEWLASGSSGGYRITVDGKDIRLNKRTLSEYHLVYKMEDWLDSEPKLCACGTDKCECGKRRAIYGTKMIDYIIMSYVIGPIERVLHRISGVEQGLQGIDEIRCILRRLRDINDSRVEGIMLDFVDFNYQHSLGAQALVFDCLGEIMKKSGSCNDVQKANEWCRQAMFNQWTTFPGDSTEYKVKMGLFSGQRGTNFINTLLNVAYFRCAQKFIRYQGLDEPMVIAIHQGDDMWVICIGSRIYGVMIYHVMKQAGFLFNDSKQSFGACQGEFLRMIYSKGECSGYMSRALAPLLIHSLQGAPIIDPRAKAKSMNDSILLLHRRGLSTKACRILWYGLVPYYLKIVLQDNRSTHIPTIVAVSSVRQNGLGLSPPGEFCVANTNLPRLPGFTLRSKILEKVVPKHMAHDWLQVVSREYKDSFNLERLQSMLHRVNVTDSATPSDRYDSLGYFVFEMKTYLEKFSKAGYSYKKYSLMDLVDNTPSNIRVVKWITSIYDGMDEKRHRKVNAVASYIGKAISLCPFQSFENARAAFDGTDFEIFVLCVYLCPDHTIKKAAFTQLDALALSVGPGVLIKITKGLHNYYPEFGAYLSPLVMTLGHEYAFEYTITNFMYQGENTRNFEEEFAVELLSVFSTIIKDGRLLKICHI